MAAETSLYPAVKRFLEAAGFAVKGEVSGCDIVAVRPGEPQTLTVVELKLGITLELLLQAVDRTRVADEVWLAVPATRRGRDRDPRVLRLCRLLGFGLLAVHVALGWVEVLAEPGPYAPRRDHRRRSGLLREHARRVGDPRAGGGSRQPIMTARTGNRRWPVRRCCGQGLVGWAWCGRWRLTPDASCGTTCMAGLSAWSGESTG